MKTTHDLRFSHSNTTYSFRGEAISAPAPGTYDAAKWTPPTHKMYHVTVQNDGLWVLKLFTVELQSGDNGSRSRKWAESVIVKYLHESGQR